jgi:hypothetical protein
MIVYLADTPYTRGADLIKEIANQNEIYRIIIYKQKYLPMESEVLYYNINVMHVHFMIGITIKSGDNRM